MQPRAKPYRDDRSALEARRDDLRQELADLTRKTEELRAAVNDREGVERELASIEARLAYARRAPSLENLRVASPCKANWDAMTGDDRVRFCDQCQKNVYDLSAMTRDEAERLLAEREGSMCVRLYKRADGTVITSDCPVGVRKKRVRLAVISTAAAAASAVAAFAFSRTTMMGDVGPSHTMGAIAVPDDQYVDKEVTPSDDPSLVLVLWNEPRNGQGVTERWFVHADGRVMRQIGGGPLEAALLTNVDHVGPLVRLAAQLAPTAKGIIHPAMGSVAHTGFTVYGKGQRQPTHADIEDILTEMRGITGPRF